jgi:hypothetical protein
MREQAATDGWRERGSLDVAVGLLPPETLGRDSGEPPAR